MDKLPHKHYMQYLLAAILTVVIFYFTSAWWCGNVVVVSFDAEAKKDIQYKLFYDETTAQRMNKHQFIEKNVKSGSQKVKILLPVSKLIKLRLALGDNPGNIVISNLRISGIRDIRLDYNEFDKHKIDKYEIINDKLHISSKRKNPYLTYAKNLNLVAKLRIDWSRLITIFVLVFMFAYKFVQYLSLFEIKEHYSRIDIVMLTIFFALLFVPMSHISDAKKSEQENRLLAPKPQLIIDKIGVCDFGGQFDAWYNDHFFGRESLIKLYDYIKKLVPPMFGNNKVLIGKDGWLFFKLENSVNDYANSVILSSEQLKDGLDYLKAIDEWCKKNGKEFYYVVVPDKSKIYGEYYRLVKKQRSDRYDIGKQFTDYIKNNSDIKVIYLYDVLMKNKDKGYLYYKHDTHWSDLGAYYGYKALMKLMNVSEKKFKFDIVPFYSREFSSFGHSSIGDLDRMIGMYSTQDTTSYYRLKIKDTSLCRSYDINVRKNKCANPSGDRNLFMLRDSFGGTLLYFLSNHFNNIYTDSIRSIKKADLENIKQNYDVVILENVERYIPDILDKTFPDKAN